jgi:hypothetical protein
MRKRKQKKKTVHSDAIATPRELSFMVGYRLSAIVVAVSIEFDLLPTKFKGHFDGFMITDPSLKEPIEIRREVIEVGWETAGTFVNAYFTPRNEGGLKLAYITGNNEKLHAVVEKNVKTVNKYLEQQVKLHRKLKTTLK